MKKNNQNFTKEEIAAYDKNVDRKNKAINNLARKQNVCHVLELDQNKSKINSESSASESKSSSSKNSNQL
ncbi:hypothetical protein [Spiroplasma endosymbiont of Melieria omissa]|uniref:hypothetical protein n=1 Tax=Spiroplasma endosymbiont of Melieria omissa TaxID=3139324 RepID=UPI003CCA7F4E